MLTKQESKAYKRLEDSTLDLVYLSSYVDDDYRKDCF